MSVEETLKERGKTHGDFRDQAIAAQTLKKTVREHMSVKVNYPQHEVLDMVCTKMSRILCGDPNEPDHWKDIAGYATLEYSRLTGDKS